MIAEHLGYELTNFGDGKIAIFFMENRVRKPWINHDLLGGRRKTFTQLPLGSLLNNPIRPGGQNQRGNIDRAGVRE